MPFKRRKNIFGGNQRKRTAKAPDNVPLPNVDNWTWTHKRIAYCHYYLTCYSPKNAAMQAGFSKLTAENQANQLHNHPAIKQYIKALFEDRTKRLKITQENVLREIACIAYSRPPRNDDGTVKTLAQLTDEELAAVDGYTVKEIFDGKGKSRKHIGNQIRYTRYNKTECLKMLASHVGLNINSRTVKQTNINPTTEENMKWEEALRLLDVREIQQLHDIRRKIEERRTSAAMRSGESVSGKESFKLYKGGLG